ncbi:hypothetical protein PVAND_014904 [Polypedilum vanderplanki]|uniref:C2H2-type domain-containing protein n=1 Tax=Polypedilum vanderplanki TaxID=319348 RepID=A0A9J6BAJ4_POLVA|nr:hypothetical protein PVAND_014904 [Polypedilum vanderplanki]
MNRRSEVKTTIKVDSENSNENEIKVKEEPMDQEISSNVETEISKNSISQEASQKVVPLETVTETTETPQIYVQSSMKNAEDTEINVSSPKIIPKIEKEFEITQETSSIPKDQKFFSKIYENLANSSKTSENQGSSSEISEKMIKIEQISPKSNIKIVQPTKQAPKTIKIVKVSSASVNQAQKISPKTSPASVKIIQNQKPAQTIQISQKSSSQVPKISQIFSRSPQSVQKPIQVQTSMLKVIQKPANLQNQMQVQKSSQNSPKILQKSPQIVQKSPIQNSSIIIKKQQNSSVTLQSSKGPIKISSNIPQGLKVSTETIQIKKEKIDDDENVTIKTEKIEPSNKPIIIQSFQSLHPIKQEKEENFDISLPSNTGEDYGDIEVLDEYYDEVMNVSPTLLKEIKTEPEEEAKKQGRMNLRGVKLNTNEMLGKKERKYERVGKGEAKNGENFPKYQKIVKSEEKSPKIVQIGRKNAKSEEKFKPQALHFLDDDAPSCFYPDRPYRCKKCPLSFKNRKDFSDHRRIHKKSDHQCDKCGQRFRFQASYLNHDCDFWCNICGKSISNKANLKIHLNYVHNIGSAKIFTCDLCGRFYKSKRNIDTHMKNHMSVTPFNCAICGKGFSHAGALKIHMWNHRDVVNCEYCHKKFKPRSLYYHVKKCPKNYEVYGNVSGVETIKEEFVTEEVVLEQEIKQPPNSKPVVVIRMKN